MKTNMFIPPKIFIKTLMYETTNMYEALCCAGNAKITNP